MALKAEIQNRKAMRSGLQKNEAELISNNHQAVASGEQIIQLVASNAPIILFMIDSKGIVRLSTGKPIERMGGDRPKNTVGYSIYEIYQSTPQVLRAFERALAGESFSQVIEIGSMVFDTRYTPFRDANGQIVGVVGVATDITDIRRAETALAQSEALFSDLFERAGIGIVLKDANGMMTRFNPAFRNMLGYTVEEMRKFHYNDITHPLDQALSDQLFHELVTGQRDSYSLEKRYLRKDGTYAWARMTATPMMGPDNRPRFVLGMVEDITGRKQIEVELEEVRHRLMRSRENERLRLAQELHDGPLQEIIALSFQIQTLDGAIIDQEDLEQIHSMQHTLEELATRLRSIAGELRPPALAPFGLEKAIESHAEVFQKQHPELTLKLRLTRDGQSLPEDLRLALFRIYQESLNNILKHSSASSVWVRFFSDEERAVLEVQDNGKGFVVPHRWLALARGNHMGLIGSRERAEALGGKLEIESSPGKGTLIRAIVPHNGNIEL